MRQLDDETLQLLLIEALIAEHNRLAVAVQVYGSFAAAMAPHPLPRGEER